MTSLAKTRDKLRKELNSLNDVNQKTEKELEKIDLKLQGVLEGNTAPVSAQGQVRHLINEATSLRNLCQMYSCSAHRHPY